MTHISVDVGTADDPNVVSASAKTKGSGDAHASLVTSNNYGITGKSFETEVTPGQPEVVAETQFKFTASCRLSIYSNDKQVRDYIG